MKAITPVIALVMLLLITVGTVGGSYVWMSGIMTSNIEKTILIPPGGAYCRDNKISVVVQNTGATTNVTDEDIVIADINGIDVRNSIFFGDFDRSGLVGYWRFEGDAKDSSGYGNDGVVTSATLTANGKFGSGYTFGGVHDHNINVGSDEILNALEAITIAAWVKPEILGQHVVVWGGGSDWQSSYVLIIRDGNFGFQFNDNGIRRYATGGSTAGLNNEWFHLAVTYDSSTGEMYLFVNGVRTMLAPEDASVSRTFGDVKIGDASGVAAPQHFNGDIDEVKIWNRPLEPEEIILLNRTNSGNFTLGPGQGRTILTNYPVLEPGIYAVRIGTSSGVIETVVNCV